MSEWPVGTSHWKLLHNRNRHHWPVHDSSDCTVRGYSYLLFRRNVWPLEQWNGWCSCLTALLPGYPGTIAWQHYLLELAAVPVGHDRHADL
ncbi:hypothetical protein ANCCEY_04443 [Ancylostoma ceylanicum]|uniref:Uncharacterized protein n=1 Tax=Ancylostoma ceylanicum TaxID=53326 RepID=A0A0D6LXB3_9BILA|nr:hypothetical protein ANCCEY_04443 [Ancylostoma ceylanicum]